jgi:hypothetical protein
VNSKNVVRFKKMKNTCWGEKSELVDKMFGTNQAQKKIQNHTPCSYAVCTLTNMQ